MVERSGGTIVNTSWHAFTGLFGGTGYPAGQGGVNSLTMAFAAELHEHGVGERRVPGRLYSPLDGGGLRASHR